LIRGCVSISDPGQRSFRSTKVVGLRRDLESPSVSKPETLNGQQKGSFIAVLFEASPLCPGITAMLIHNLSRQPQTDRNPSQQPVQSSDHSNSEVGHPWACQSRQKINELSPCVPSDSISGWRPTWTLSCHRRGRRISRGSTGAKTRQPAVRGNEWEKV
jgi:hypothetical protein